MTIDSDTGKRKKKKNAFDAFSTSIEHEVKNLKDNIRKNAQYDPSVLVSEENLEKLNSEVKGLEKKVSDMQDIRGKCCDQAREYIKFIWDDILIKLIDGVKRPDGIKTHFQRKDTDYTNERPGYSDDKKIYDRKGRRETYRFQCLDGEVLIKGINKGRNSYDHFFADYRVIFKNMDRKILDIDVEFRADTSGSSNYQRCWAQGHSMKVFDGMMIDASSILDDLHGYARTLESYELEEKKADELKKINTMKGCFELSNLTEDNN